MYSSGLIVYLKIFSSLTSDAIKGKINKVSRVPVIATHHELSINDDPKAKDEDSNAGIDQGYSFSSPPDEAETDQEQCHGGNKNKSYQK